MLPSRRLLIIGLDGFTGRLLHPMVRDGVMPVLGRLLAQGTCTTVLSTVPPVTAPAWTTVATGATPGRHRIFSFFRPPQGWDETPRLTDSTDVAMPYFWNYLGAEGIATGVSHVPLTYPPTPLHGFMACPRPGSDTYELVTHPAPLAAEVGSRLSLSPELVLQRGVTVSPDYARHLIGCVGQQARVDVELMRSRPWDCFFTVCTYPDVFQHTFWSLLDPAHRDHRPAEAARFGGLLREFYHAVDDYVGRLCEEAGPETSVLLVSDHGFGRLEKLVNVNGWLESQGHLRLRTGLLDRVRHLAARHGITAHRLRELGARLDVWHLRRHLGPAMRRALWDGVEKAASPPVDWQRSQAILRYTLESGIFLRPEARPLLGRICAGLRDLRDPETGERIFESVMTREELYEGPEVVLAPDILLSPREGYVCGSGISSAALVEPQGAGRASGFHRMDGVLLASGPAFRRLEPAPVLQLADVAPTVLRLFGLGVPASMDGRPACELLATPTDPHHDGTTEVVRPVPEGRGLCEEEEREVRSRLESLGYL